MKRFFLFFFAALLSASMFAEGETGATKAQAIPYAWGEGIKVTSDAGVGKWYKVDLFGKFDPATGKSAEGNADANILVANPLDEKANVDVTAYIGDNETSRHFALGPGEFKTMNIGAGMLVRMGIQYVYMFIVMDVTIPIEQAEKIEVVVEDAPSNSTPFVPVKFDWTGFGMASPAAGNEIQKNKETWIYIDSIFNKLEPGYTFEICVKNEGTAPTTIYGGLAYDCPATSIQEQSKAVGAGQTMKKTLDKAMLDMMPDSMYIRLKADQPLHVYAVQVAPIVPDQPLFNTEHAIEIEKGEVYDFGTLPTVANGYEADSVVLKIEYNDLVATGHGDDNQYYKVEFNANNTTANPVTLTGKVAKNASGEVNSAISRTSTINTTISKTIDKTVLSNLESGDYVYVLVLGGKAGVQFSLDEILTLENPCVPAQAIELNIPAAPGIVEQPQAANSTKWYKVNITAAKNAKADIRMTMTASETVNLNVDIAAACALGEPTQSYSGSSATTVKTLSYSLIKDVAVAPKADPSDPDEYFVYVRVNTDKAITVQAEVLSSIVYNMDQYAPTGWSNGTGPTITEAARIETDMTIASGKTVKALGLTLAGGKITIEKGGKLIIAAEGIKGSETVDQILIKEGGILLIDPACTKNNKPFVTAQKKLDFGVQEAAGHTLAELHEFIALPIENREAGLGVGMRYANWDRMAGWVANDGFRQSFVGYNVFAKDGDGAAYDSADSVLVEFKGQLAANKNITLNMPANGWYAFGNSWTAPIALSGIHSQLSGNDDAAVHFYVASPTDFGGAIGILPDNYYLAATAEIASNLGITEIKPLQGFFLHTTSSYSVELDYNTLFSTKAAAPKRAAADNNNKVAAVVSDGIVSDFVYMIEGEAGNAHKMEGNKLAIYAEDGLAQVANTNLIGTILTFQANEATEYTLHFAWLNGETLYLKDLANGNIIAMTADSRYTFSADPNSISERFQVIGRHEVPTNIENGLFLEGANKRIENGKIVIIKNGVKYDVLGAQL